MQLPNEIFIPEIARLVAEGKQVVFTPTGVSMRPYIEGGVDSVTLVRPDDLQVGDIVLAEISAGHYVLHRIYVLQGDAVTLMGDGNLQGNEHCTRSRQNQTADASLAVAAHDAIAQNSIENL